MAPCVVCNNLGYLLKAQGDLAGAKPYYEQALAILLKVLGKDHSLTQTAQGNLSGLLAEMEQK